MARIFYGIIITVALLFCGCSEENDTQQTVSGEHAADKNIIVAVGDSLTAGMGVDERDSYPALLENRLRSAGYTFQVINAGVSGETSSGTLSRIEWIMTLEPDVIILETGGNDGLRGIDPVLVKENIRQILYYLEEKKVAVLLAGIRMVWNLGPEYVNKFNRVYPELAEEFGVVYMPFFLEGVATSSSLNLADGIHPNKQGYKIITDNIYPYVIETIKRAKITH